MMRTALLKIVVLVLATVATVDSGFGEEKGMTKQANPVVVIETSEGAITVELWADKAPATVENFLRYTEEGFYDNTIFHRVIKDFMIQGGGFTADMKQKPTHEPIKNEAAPELRNDRGTIAMARTNQIHSATSQFFINHKDNDFLNHRDKTQNGFGYAVFGKVVDGLEVVDRIAKVKTMPGDVPTTPVVIKRVKLLERRKDA